MALTLGRGLGIVCTHSLNSSHFQAYAANVSLASARFPRIRLLDARHRDTRLEALAQELPNNFPTETRTD